jgi:hypothetical protein
MHPSLGLMLACADCSARDGRDNLSVVRLPSPAGRGGHFASIPLCLGVDDLVQRYHDARSRRGIGLQSVHLLLELSAKALNQ